MSASGRTKRHIKYIFISLLIGSIIVGCGPSRVSEEIPPVAHRDCAPSNLTARVNDGGVFLKWDTNCPEKTILSGYNIYILDRPIYETYHDTVPPPEIKPMNIIPYPGDTDPEDSYETMPVDNLENGVEYFVSIRTVFPDRSLSVSSNELSIICRPEGRFKLEIRYRGTEDGFSFSDGQSVRADDDANDLYFYNKDDIDYIASPARLNGFLRHSKFYSLGKTKDIYQYSEFQLDLVPVDKMPVRLGESYLVNTSDNRFAKIRLEEISGEGDSRALHFTYIYQTEKGLLRF